ncbi:MAG: hypothetical protein JJ858_14595 [Rhizobiaceae bacterium]|nr:hypothetical protein [Rhizobiaceae bacterium]
MADERSYPMWIYYYLWFVTCVSTLLAIIIYIDPSAIWSHWEASTAVGAFSLSGPAGLFCARNLGTAVMGAYVLINKSKPMMEAFLLFRIVVDLLDGIHAAIGGNTPIIFIGFSTAAIELFTFVRLRRYARHRST